MATVTPTIIYNTITWENIATGDTVVEAKVAAGIYNLEIKGTWGGSTAKVLWGLSTGPTIGLSQDGATEFTATADGPVLAIGPLANGFMKPSVSGGAGASITVTLSPAVQQDEL